MFKVDGLTLAALAAVGLVWWSRMTKPASIQDATRFVPIAPASSGSPDKTMAADYWNKRPIYYQTTNPLIPTYTMGGFGESMDDPTH